MRLGQNKRRSDITMDVTLALTMNPREHPTSNIQRTTSKDGAKLR